jgi:hypothetical protein
MRDMRGILPVKRNDITEEIFDFYKEIHSCTSLFYSSLMIPFFALKCKQKQKNLQIVHFFFL